MTAPDRLTAGARSLLAAYERRAQKRSGNMYTPRTWEDVDERSRREMLEVANAIEWELDADVDRSAIALADHYHGRSDDMDVVEYWNGRIYDYLKGGEAYDRGQS